jgi:hypothetical protein
VVDDVEMMKAVSTKQSVSSKYLIYREHCKLIWKFTHPSSTPSKQKNKYKHNNFLKIFSVWPYKQSFGLNVFGMAKFLRKGLHSNC